MLNSTEWFSSYLKFISKNSQTSDFTVLSGKMQKKALVDGDLQNAGDICFCKFICWVLVFSMLQTKGETHWETGKVLLSF